MMRNINDFKKVIADLLTDNGLTHISLKDPGEGHGQIFIIWFDNDGNPYDDPISDVRLKDSGLFFEVNARSYGNTITVPDDEINRLEWWEEIHAGVLRALQRDGKSGIPSCKKEVTYPLILQHEAYTLEIVPAGNDSLEHSEDVRCHVYKPSCHRKGEKEEADSFLITGNELSDYGSMETAVTAYMRRNYPDNIPQDERQYHRLNRQEQRLQEQQKELLVKLLKRHGGHITSLPVPDKDGCSDYPVTMVLSGRHDNLNINITDVYLDEKHIRVDGVEQRCGSKQCDFHACPEHYSGLLDFAAFALGFRNV